MVEELPDIRPTVFLQVMSQMDAFLSSLTEQDLDPWAYVANTIYSWQPEHRGKQCRKIIVGAVDASA